MANLCGLVARGAPVAPLGDGRAKDGCTPIRPADAHATGQLDWQPYGCAKAVRAGVPADRVVNTKGADELVAWAGQRR